MNWKLIRRVDSFLGIPLIRLLSLLMPTNRKAYPPSGDEAPKRILLVKFWGIGNIFMLLPSIQALHSTFPEAEIDFITLESNREALESLEVVCRITTIDTSSLYAFLCSWRTTVATLSAVNYDLAIDFEQFARFSALITMQIGAAITIGFSTRQQYRHSLYSTAVEYDNHLHITRSFYALVARAGVTIPFSPNITLPSFAHFRRRGDGILKDLGVSTALPVAVMHIGTSENFRERRWAPQFYAELAELLRERYGFQVLLTGLPDESQLIRAAWQHLKSVEGIHDLGGKMGFTDYFSLITGADLVISADTAAVHLASAATIPVVGLYGPNTPDLYGPWAENGIALYASLSCSPCITNFNGKINTCRHPYGRGACMAALSVDKVFDAIEKNFLLPDAPFRKQNSSRKPA